MKWERLMNDYFDDALTSEEVAKLFEWIHSHPDNAMQFATAAFLHRRLEHRLSAMRLLQDGAALVNPQSHEPPVSDAIGTVPSKEDAQTSSPLASAPVVRSAKARFSPRLSRFWGIAAALLLMIGILSFLVWPRGSPARLVAVENATWHAGITPPKQGDQLPKGTLVLNAGLIKLSFDNGNQVLIEGPARFSIADARAITLDQGALTAIVTPAGRGLRISTPAAQVTDLGTEFGVRASATATHVMVFNGKVSVSGRSLGTAPQEFSAESAVEVSLAGISHIPFEPATFKRVMPTNIRPLDLIDLLAGGDGMGSASGVGINAATGRTRETRAVTIRLGNHRYLPVTDYPVLDGSFIPDGSMPVDSAGHIFTFPATTLISYGLIWSGPNIPWEGELPIATTLPQDAGTPTSRVLVMHSNNGFTLNLNAIRALHTQVRITGFRARVGNSYRPARPGANPARTLASIHVIVDGVARYEKRAFANTDAPMDVAFAFSDNDHFLTLATTDGGDGNSCDWVLWTHPELVVRDAER